MINAGSLPDWDNYDRNEAVYYQEHVLPASHPHILPSTNQDK
jgi:hypothetical protein